MKDDYFWWDLENSEFKYLLYNSIGMYFLHDDVYQTWNELLENAPHMAYAYLIDIRFNTLEQQFVDLRVIPQLLGVESLPVKSIVMDINRYDWLKLIADLALSRFSSVRDILFQFINEVIELKIDGYKLNFKNLERKLKGTHPEVIENLKLINEAGTSLRKDRNERMHKGFSDLLTGNDELFKNMSWAEGYGPFFSPDYDLETVYKSSRDKIYDLFVKEVENALKITIEIVDALYMDYSNNFERLSNHSKRNT